VSGDVESHHGVEFATATMDFKLVMTESRVKVRLLLHL